jgi:hypothetical protein
MNKLPKFKDVNSLNESKVTDGDPRVFGDFYGFKPKAYHQAMTKFYNNFGKNLELVMTKVYGELGTSMEDVLAIKYREVEIFGRSKDVGGDFSVVVPKKMSYSYKAFIEAFNKFGNDYGLEASHAVHGYTDTDIRIYVKPWLVNGNEDYHPMNDR